uniref:Uncharacterized protein n=1 Tax=Rhabditophanes sp. KR3021 TaxID=114890 RepID=A0AC35U152_9BILA
MKHQIADYDYSSSCGRSVSYSSGLTSELSSYLFSDHESEASSVAPKIVPYRHNNRYLPASPEYSIYDHVKVPAKRRYDEKQYYIDTLPVKRPRIPAKATVEPPLCNGCQSKYREKPCTKVLSGIDLNNTYVNFAPKQFKPEIPVLKPLPPVPPKPLKYKQILPYLYSGKENDNSSNSRQKSADYVNHQMKYKSPYSGESFVLFKDTSSEDSVSPDECYGSDSYSDFNDDETNFMNITEKICDDLDLKRQTTAEISNVKDKEPQIYSMMVIRILSFAREKRSKKVSKAQLAVEDLLRIPHVVYLNCYSDDKSWERNTIIFGNQITEHLAVIKRRSQDEFETKAKKLYKILRDVKEKSFVKTAISKISTQIRKLF